ncbi:MAG: beta-lactamase family protein [Chloroflexi bacterium]|nr:beta-lactamase family protein [Chloroflexota bacterium]
MKDWQLSTHAIGVTLAVSTDGRGGWVGTAGVSDRDDASPVAPDALFRVGSITKTFVAVIILQLVEEGTLDLDDRVRDYVPSYAAGDQVTIRQLLQHTSGLEDFQPLPEFEEAVIADLNKRWRPIEVLEFVSPEPQFEPGTAWSYSSTGYVALGMAMEAATGNSLSSEIRSRIIEPLSLGSTYLAGHEEGPEGLVRGYDDVLHVGTLFDLGSIPYTAIETAAWAAGGIVSSAEDLARFAVALFGGELLTDASLDQMLTIVQLETEPPDWNYGLGLIQFPTDSGPVWGHDGAIPGFDSLFVYSPRQRVAVVALTNGNAASNTLIPLLNDALAVISGDD